ncbi:MAG: hypothetical protein EBT98_08890 [Opitutaceae bacterium]|jgi:hypothetical protein|nr:hypothetical protein [Opitutaceae bacterium]NBR57968.1 hypothetical protein [Opitutaceae bacterium]
MSFRLLSVLGMIAGLWLFATLGHATSVEAPNFEQLVSQADYVVRGVITSITPEWRDNQGRPYILSKVTLELREIIKGTPPQPLVMEFVGGRMGAEELVIEGAPKFHLGEENILFVQGNGQQIYPLVGIMHGLYVVYKEAQSGQELILRSNGLPLYSEQDVALPLMSWDAVKRANPQARPMTTAAFTQKIRAVSARAESAAALAK